MVIHDVVVNDHAVRVAAGRVLAAGAFDVVNFRAVGHVDELESIAATHPNHVLADVSNQTGDIVVAAVQHPVVFGERREPLVVGDVVAQHAQTFRSNVGGVAHDFHHGVTRLGVLAPVVIVLEVGFRDEAHPGCRSTVHVVAVKAHAVGGPVGHAVVDVLTVVDAHGGDAVFADADVGAGVEAATTNAGFNSEVKELLGPRLPG